MVLLMVIKTMTVQWPAGGVPVIIPYSFHGGLLTVGGPSCGGIPIVRTRVYWDLYWGRLILGLPH